MTRTAAALTAALTSAALAAGCGGADNPGGPNAGKQPPAELGRSVARIDGVSSTDVSAAAVLAAFPPDQGAKPHGWVLVRRDRWRDVVAAAQFAAPPLNAGLLPIDRHYLPTAAFDVISREHVGGFPRAQGVQALAVGRLGREVFADLQGQSLKPTAVTSQNASTLVSQLVPYRGGWSHAFSDTIVIVSSEQRDFALPGAAWSAYSGDSVGFVSHDAVPAATAKLLAQREKLRLNKPTMYVIGPRSIISDAVVGELRRYGAVQRIAGSDAAATAVALARYRDPKTGFGWGMQSAPASVTLANPHDWGNAVAGLNLAGSGPQAPLLLTAPDGSLPRAVSDYLGNLQGSTGTQAFILGSRRSIPSATLKAVDGILSNS
jgi:hypothetical protein